MKVTREFIMNHRTKRGAWTRDQLACLGISWPPEKGWIKRVEGLMIPDADAERFIALGIKYDLWRSQAKPKTVSSEK
jgi:hypothetical protein